MTAQTEKAGAWVYRGIWSVLVRWFRVPDRPPSLPVATDERIDSFQPIIGFRDYLKLWCVITLVIIGLAACVLWIVVTIWEWWVGLLILPVGVLAFAAIGSLALMAVYLRYDTTWYVMTDRSLRIRRGIWVIHEMTITFENVQNVKLHSGPVQRAFGFSNLVVETAGGGAGEKQKHGFAIANKGVIEGIANAEALRDRILARLQASRGAGLGDEDDEAGPRASPWSAAHLDALRSIRDEARRLSRAFPTRRQDN